MWVKFEEKTFESYFNNELDRLGSIYFPPGQVQEGVLGLDSASYSRSWRLWRKLGYPFWFTPRFSGVDLRKIADEMENYLNEEVNNVPQMNVNLLFQYKRPEFITQNSGKEWDLWHQKYFRYDLYAKQHALLAHIEKKFGNDAIVLYAAPAIENVTELVKIKKKGKIIDNSNFRRASDLKLHHRNTYITAGTYSQGCSDPERLDNFNLLHLIEKIKPIERRENREVLINFSEGVISSLQEETHLKEAFDILHEEFRELRKYKLFYAVMAMRHFRELTGTQWILTVDKRV